MEVRWPFQEVTYPTVNSSKGKNNHLTNTRSFPRTQGLGFPDKKDPLNYAQYNRWETDPFQGISLGNFRIRGTKRYEELPERENMSSTKDKNHIWLSTVTLQRPWSHKSQILKENVSSLYLCTKQQISCTGRHFQTGKDSCAPFSGGTRGCVSLKHRCESREPWDPGHRSSRGQKQDIPRSASLQSGESPSEKSNWLPCEEIQMVGKESGIEFKNKYIENKA